MSPKSLDPLSQRKNDSAAAESTPVVPRGVDASKVLEKAQATVEARKEAQAKSKRRIISGGLMLGLVVFVVGALVLAGQQYQKDLQVKQAEETLNDARENLAQLEIVKKLDDGQKEEFYKKAGAQYLAAQEIGIISGSEQDQQLLNFLVSASPGADGTAEAINRLIEARLAVVKTTGYYEGYLFNYWYGNTAVDWPANYNVPRQGNAQALEEDKQYAIAQAKEDMNRLKTGKATPDVIIAEINSDFRLWMREDPNGSSKIASSVVAANMPRQASVNTSDIVSETINSMNEVGYSDIAIRKYVSVYDKNKTPFEAGYFFIKLDKLVRGEAALEKYQAELASYQEKLK